MKLKRIAALLCLAAGLALATAGAAAAADDPPPDAWITTKVKMALLTEEGFDALEVDVDTFDGIVTLHGPVESRSQKQRAEERAQEVDGVREVRNLLAVVPEAAREETEAADEEIRDRVRTVLDRDAALEESNIEVKSVTDGVVVLAGKAETLSAHRRALEDARSVDGVRRVASEIESPDDLEDREIWRQTADEAESGDARSGLSDTWITTQLKVALMSDPGLSPLAINVDTREGVVTLFGSVESDETKQAAERRARDISGVRGVENELQVVPDVAAERVEAQDDEIREAVRSRLRERSALEDADLDVEVSAGVVRLTGTVASQHDRMTALSVARATQGVASVVDDLRLAESRAESQEDRS